MALRNVIEDLVVRVADNPVIITEPSEEDQRVLSAIRLLTRSDCGKYGVQQQQQSDIGDFKSEFRRGGFEGAG